MKPAWTVTDGNIIHPSLMHAVDGLSSFTMLDLNEDQVALLNDEQDLLNTASLVSIADLRGQRNKINISIPAKADEFMLMLKRCANLLYAVFTNSFSFFKALLKVIHALREFLREAHKRTTMLTKGSILWIVLLQFRQFALGEVNLLCEFTTMHEDLCDKRASILHSKMPSDLLTNSEPETSQQDRPKNPPTNATIDVDITPKKPKLEPPNKSTLNPK